MHLMSERVSSPTLTQKLLERSANAAIIDGLRHCPVRTIEEVKRATLQGKTAHQAKSIAHGPTTHSSEVLGAALIAPAVKLAISSVECQTCEYAHLSNWGRGLVVQLQGSTALPGLYCSLTTKYVS